MTDDEMIATAVLCGARILQSGSGVRAHYIAVTKDRRWPLRFTPGRAAADALFALEIWTIRQRGVYLIETDEKIRRPPDAAD